MRNFPDPHRHDDEVGSDDQSLMWRRTSSTSRRRLARRRPAARRQKLVFHKDFQGFWLTVTRPGCAPPGSPGDPGPRLRARGGPFIFLRFSNGFRRRSLIPARVPPGSRRRPARRRFGARGQKLVFPLVFEGFWLTVSTTGPPPADRPRRLCVSPLFYNGLRNISNVLAARDFRPLIWCTNIGNPQP